MAAKDIVCTKLIVVLRSTMLRRALSICMVMQTKFKYNGCKQKNSKVFYSVKSKHYGTALLLSAGSSTDLDTYCR